MTFRGLCQVAKLDWRLGRVKSIDALDSQSCCSEALLDLGNSITFAIWEARNIYMQFEGGHMKSGVGVVEAGTPRNPFPDPELISQCSIAPFSGMLLVGPSNPGPHLTVPGLLADIRIGNNSISPSGQPWTVPPRSQGSEAQGYRNADHPTMTKPPPFSSRVLRRGRIAAVQLRDTQGKDPALHELREFGLRHARDGQIGDDGNCSKRLPDDLEHDSSEFLAPVSSTLPCYGV